MKTIPKRFKDFKKNYREIAKSYEDLGAACHAAGPLNDRSRALVKLAISVGARLEGGVHSQVRKALDAGVTKDEMYHVAFLAIPTIGFPSAMAAMSWIEDIVRMKSAKKH